MSDNAVVHNVQFTSGAITCASEPGVFCRFVYTKNFGTKYICHLFDDMPLFEHETGPHKHWLARCIPCMKEYE